jgi:chromate transporter
VLLLLSGGTGTQIAVLAAAGLAGALLCHSREGDSSSAPAMTVPPVCAWLALALFALLLAALLLLSWRYPRSGFAFAAIFYRAGALVFGGGHVVLPLLRAALVPQGWLSDDTFLTGYGLAQAVPGPLFTVAAYLGAVTAAHAAATHAATAVACIFLPGLLLAVAGLSLWRRLERHRRVRAAMVGVNAAVVGILAAALYNPIWTTAVGDGADVAVAAGALVLLLLRAPPLVAVMLCVACSVLRSFL